MALPSCRRCGKQHPQRMHGLMSLWFAPLIELEADLGYFYLCPACHDEVIVPELERIQNRILELHPAAQRALDHELDEAAPVGEAGVGGGVETPAETDASAGRNEDDAPAEQSETDAPDGSDQPGAADESSPVDSAGGRETA